MKRLTTLLLMSGFILSLGAAGAGAADWQDLFDGKTLNGWVQRNGKAKYTVEDGTIVGTTVLNTPNSFLCTEKMYTDFVLELEYLVQPGMNSGIQISQQQLQALQELPRAWLSDRDRYLVAGLERRHLRRSPARLAVRPQGQARSPESLQAKRV